MRVKIRTALSSMVLQITDMHRCGCMLTVICANEYTKYVVIMNTEDEAMSKEAELLKEGFVDLSAYIATN